MMMQQQIIKKFFSRRHAHLMQQGYAFPETRRSKCNTMICDMSQLKLPAHIRFIWGHRKGGEQQNFIVRFSR